MGTGKEWTAWPEGMSQQRACPIGGVSRQRACPSGACPGRGRVPREEFLERPGEAKAPEGPSNCPLGRALTESWERLLQSPVNPGSG